MDGVEPDVVAWQQRLITHPRRAAELERPSGPLRFAFPEVRGPLRGAPVWVVDVRLDAADGTVAWTGVLAWTPPPGADGLVLRFPAEALGADVDALDASVPLTVDGDLVTVDVDVVPGRTLAVWMSGALRVPARSADAPERLSSADGATTLVSWLPLPTPCGPEGCDRTHWTGASDPGSADAMVFLARVHTDAATLLHPGVGWRMDDGAVGIAAVGVRELPLIALDERWSAEVRPGDPVVRTWARDADAVRGVADRARATVDDLTRRYGPLPHHTLDLVASLPGVGQGVELPGVILLAPQPTVDEEARLEPDRCWVVAHEVAHQWWYGEVGSDALREPWVDESLAAWSSLDACRRAGVPGVDERQDVLLRLMERQGAAASAPASGLEGAAWTVVYARGAAFWDALREADAEGLDDALATWLRHERWRMGTGEALRGTLRQRLDADVVDAAWATWMTGRY